MIFGRDLAKLIARGKKTATRRPVNLAPTSDVITRRDGSVRRRPPMRVDLIDGRVYKACRYKVGHSYAVQPGRGRAAIARIIVTSVKRQRLADITLADALAEGFRTRDAFKIAWVRIHDRAWIRREHVDLAAAFGDDVVPWILLERFHQEHDDTAVWAIEFVLDRDAPRYLSPAANGDGDSDETAERPPVPAGYTPQPARGLFERHQSAPQPDLDRNGRQQPPRILTIPEPEPVDDATLARFALDAAERRASEPGRRAEDLRKKLRALTVTLRQDAIAADRRGVDVSDVIQRLEQAKEHLKLLERNQDAA